MATTPDFRLSGNSGWKPLGKLRERLETVEKHYMHTYNKRLGREKEDIVLGKNVFLRLEKCYNKDICHKLPHITEGPFEVKPVNTELKSVVIIPREHSVKSI